MALPVSELDFVTIKTTAPLRPFPLNGARKQIRTKRLILRPFEDTDLDALHGMRIQPEVMWWTIQGRPDIDLDESRANLAKRMPPNDATTYDMAIVEAATGAFVGCGGSTLSEGKLGWPEIGYMFCKEAWGKGYASEFLGAFIEVWWALPRQEVQLSVDRSTIDEDDQGEVKREKMTGVTQGNNEKSQGVLRKAGFNLVKIWNVEDSHEEFKGQMTTLQCFALARPA